MISRLKITIDLPYIILLSHDRKKNRYGWAIILKDKVTILIDPTRELEEYCSGDELLIFKSNDNLTESRKIKIGNVSIYLGVYLQKPYLYLPEGILFSMGVSSDRWPKLMKELEPKFIFTPQGRIQKQMEAYLQGILN